MGTIKRGDEERLTSMPMVIVSKIQKLQKSICPMLQTVTWAVEDTVKTQTR